jgi:predicted neutral ceramidase superfamily lipid hydrolase
MVKASSENGDRQTRKATSFKWVLSALLAVLLVLALGFDRDALDSYGLLGAFVVATVLLLFFGVRTTKGIWIVGSALLGMIVLGLIFFAESVFAPSSIEEISGLAIVPVMILTSCVALVGAVVDTLVRVTGRRRNRGQAPV